MSGNITVSAENIDGIKTTVDNTLRQIGTFYIIEPRVIPQGLKPIAGSVSWLIEQVVVQNLRLYKDINNLESVIDPPHNLTQYDCILKYNIDPRRYHVNIKTSLAQTSSNSRFDISKAQKLIDFYEENPDLILVLAVIKIDISGSQIIFRDSIVFNVAWTPDIYYNRANHNLQSCCDGSQVVRSNLEFVRILRQKMEERGHSTHY